MILDQIVHDKRLELDASKRRASLADLRSSELYSEARRPFVEALAARPRAIIAEVKKASPSKGIIRADFDPVWIAREYASSGAAAISVLTERNYFQGALEYLAQIRSAVSLPLLRKDFLFDPYQVTEARAAGADAVLLIVAMLDDAALRDLHARALDEGLAVLVEVHDRDELDRARQVQPALLGINNRDLKTFHTTLATTENLVPAIDWPCIVVGESGIDSREDIARLERVGVRTFLIGESLMRAERPGQRLANLLEP